MAIEEEKEKKLQELKAKLESSTALEPEELIWFLRDWQRVIDLLHLIDDDTQLDNPAKVKARDNLITQYYEKAQDIQRKQNSAIAISFTAGLSTFIITLVAFILALQFLLPSTASVGLAIGLASAVAPTATLLAFGIGFFSYLLVKRMNDDTSSFKDLIKWEKTEPDHALNAAKVVINEKLEKIDRLAERFKDPAAKESIIEAKADTAAMAAKPKSALFTNSGKIRKTLIKATDSKEYYLGDEKQKQHYHIKASIAARAKNKTSLSGDIKSLASQYRASKSNESAKK